MGVLKSITKVATKVIVATMIGFSTIFTPVVTQAIVEPPKIECQYEVYRGKVYEGQEIEIIVEDEADTKESTFGAIKRWITHPIESTDKKINDIKEEITDDFKTYSDETKELIENKIDGLIDTLQAKWISECIKTMTGMFQFIMNSIIILPTELITNDAIRSLYFKLLVVSVGLMAVFTVYNCLISIVDENNYMGFAHNVTKLFKAILFMLCSVVYLPLFTLWINELSSGILSLAIKQVEMNILVDYFNNPGLISISGTFGMMIMCFMVTVFLFQVFFHTCCRYWEMCKVFCTAPLVLAMSVVPSQDYIYISWKNKLKHIFFIQVLYALHLSVFITLMSVKFDSNMLNVMVFIGGVWDLTKIPNSLDDIFRSNSVNKTKMLIKEVATALIGKKVPLAKAATKATGPISKSTRLTK